MVTRLEPGHHAASTSVGGSSRRCPLGSVLRGALAIQPRAHRRQNLRNVAHQIVTDLSGVHHNQLAFPGGQRRLDIPGPEQAKTVPVLDHDPLHRRVTQRRKELAAVPIQRRTDLGDDLVDRDLLRRGPRGHARTQ